MQRPLGAFCRPRIVSDHDDGLAVIAIERLQEIENLIAGLAIEIAGGLVAQEQCRIGDDCARNADALLLPARQLPRIMLRALGQPDDVERDADAFATLVLSTGSSTATADRRCVPPSARAAGCRAETRSRCSRRASAIAARRRGW